MDQSHSNPFAFTKKDRFELIVIYGGWTEGILDMVEQRNPDGVACVLEYSNNEKICIHLNDDMYTFEYIDKLREVATK